MRASATRALAIALRQFYLLRGSVSRVLPLFVWVAVDIILWGFITSYLNAVRAAGFDCMAADLPMFLPGWGDAHPARGQPVLRL